MTLEVTAGALTGAHERAHPNQLKADDAISLFVYLRKISFSVIVVCLHIFIFFIFWSPWVLFVACLKMSYGSTDIRTRR